MPSQERASMVSSTLAESVVALIGEIFFITPRVPTIRALCSWARWLRILTVSMLRVTSRAADQFHNWLFFEVCVLSTVVRGASPHFLLNRITAFYHSSSVPISSTDSISGYRLLAAK
eukprot:IDg16342t1